MDKNESSAILSDIERENADRQDDGSINLRIKLGLPLNATSKEVYAKLKEQHGLPEGATDKEVIHAMLIDFSLDLNNLNNQLNIIQKRHKPSIGRIASLFMTRG